LSTNEDFLMSSHPLGDLPHLHAIQKPTDDLALIYPNGALSWMGLERQASRRARLYQSLGVRKNDFVTVAMPNGLPFHETLFAVWKLGATPNIVSPKLPLHEFSAILDVVKPSLVIGGPNDSSELVGWNRAEGDEDLTGFDDAHLSSEIASAWRAMTSGGSTGRPKVILDRTPAALDIGATGPRSAINLEPTDVLLNPGPLYHSAPFLAANRALFLGATVVGMVRFDAEEALRLIDRYRVTWVTFVPTMMHRIWALPLHVRENYDLSSLRAVWHMGAPCPVWLKEAWIDWLGADRIWELYGGTEAVGTTVINGNDWLGKRGSVGRPIGDSRAMAVREDGHECLPGEVGEIHFKDASGNARTSYLGAQAKVAGDGWLSYGDLGHIDEDGYVFLADRRVDLILRGGANIYPAEVEAAIEAHPDVECAVVVGLPCEDLGQRVHAIVKLASGMIPDPERLNRFVKERIASYKLPDSYEYSQHQLRDDAGKVRRSALRDERGRWLAEGLAFQQLVERTTPTVPPN
jgi:bile acid-coenzyme A ligase